ncbi:MAG: hypothetical protein HYU51_19290 [Candidatus Rokubacteria bacterium]|nr:hypothetical protein [Candidatus Rokubacteria bacterium]
MAPAKVHVWTLLDARDEATEDRLAEAELKLMASFPEVKFDFTSVHLMGRDPLQFIPQSADVVIARRDDLRSHFHEALRTRLNASA